MAQTLESSTPASRLGEATWGDYFELTKPRLSLLAILTAIVGYLAALPERNLGELILLIIGTSMAAGGAAALNMWMERGIDARMARTRDRPVPAGLIEPGQALAIGIALGLIGSLVVAGINPLAGLLAALTIATYIGLYTPLKPLTPWAMHIGVIPGALPPLIGWAAAEGSLPPLAWSLFGILALWQIPHFIAIGWMYRKDYADGGIPVLTVTDPSGRAAGRHAVAAAVLHLAVCLYPAIVGDASWLYGSGALIGGGIYLAAAIGFALDREAKGRARRLFFASITVLPIVLGLLVADRWLLA